MKVPVPVLSKMSVVEIEVPSEHLCFLYLYVVTVIKGNLLQLHSAVLYLWDGKSVVAFSSLISLLSGLR